MTTSDKSRNLFGPVIYFASNWITALGILLTTTGGVAWMFTLPGYLSGEGTNPYLGLLTVLLLPATFIAGLVLMPVGVWIAQRKSREAGTYPTAFPVPGWADRKFRQLVWLIGLATTANVVIGGHLTYSAVEHMDSPSFCGETCHIMAPEFASFQHAPHSQLQCVQCHIGEGFNSYVEAKLNGAKQLIEVMMDSYPRPVPSPVHNLAQGQLACVKCHAAQDVGGKIREWFIFDEDEANSARRTELMLFIGGGDNPTGAHGAHMSNGAKVEYRSDPSRQDIAWVRYTAPDGTVTEFAKSGWDESKAGELESRTMDCIDCHNRAAHAFESPNKAIDAALVGKAIDAALPYVRREGFKLITAKYSSREEAAERIPAGLEEFYRAEYPEVASAQSQAVARAGAELLKIYSRNVFPQYNLDWGQHPNNQGHEDYPGCFRCHNDDMVVLDAEQRPIGDRCEDCHETRVIDQPVSLPTTLTREGGPARDSLPTLVSYATELGPVAFDHAEHVDYEKGDCTACHNRFFRMSKGVPNFGGGDLHETALRAKSSCAGCHFAGAEIFGVEGECQRCHENLTEPKVIRAISEVVSRLPSRVEYKTTLGTAWFDHGAHANYDNVTCSSCHNQLFPMEPGAQNYGAGIHTPAEAAKTACAGCHVAGGTAFASENNCMKCHEGLGVTRATPQTGRSGLPEALAFATRLGKAEFGHEKHVEEANGDCLVCHNKLFPMNEGAAEGYADDLHRSAEKAKSSCGACHVDGGEAFASKDNCTKCHVELTATAKGSAMGLPAKLEFENRLALVEFDHDQHIVDAKGLCMTCHQDVFPMAKGELDFADVDEFHRKSESERKSCGKCHVPGGEAFGSLNNCTKCHIDLELPAKAQIPWPLAMLLFFAVPAAGQTSGQQPSRPSGSGYVGSTRCAVCHEEEAAAFETNPHVVIRETARFEAKITLCEACHGPGLEHVLALDREQLNPIVEDPGMDSNAACLACHAGNESFENHFFDRHAQNGVACTTCHNVHTSPSAILTARNSDALCSECHTEVRAAFSRPFRHKLNEGAVHCVDCHNPHGQAPSGRVARVFGADASCMQCHADKRGPFPFEHTPVKLESCSTCHEPHGSANPRMLARHDTSQLCIECHSMLTGELGGPPPLFHDVRTARIQACTTCHQKIHGSYVSRDFLR